MKSASNAEDVFNCNGSQKNTINNNLNLDASQRKLRLSSAGKERGTESIHPTQQMQSIQALHQVAGAHHHHHQNSSMAMESNHSHHHH